MTYAAAQFVTNLAGIGIDVAQNLLCLFRREDAQIAAGNAQVGADAHRAHTDQDAVCSLGLLLKDVTQFLLDESGYFLLSGCFHKAKNKRRSAPQRVRCIQIIQWVV